jgi:WD40 repeat protein
LPGRCGTITAIANDGKRTFLGTSRGYVRVYERVTCIAEWRGGGRVAALELVGGVVMVGRNEGAEVRQVGEDDDEDDDSDPDSDDEDLSAISGAAGDSDSDSDDSHAPKPAPGTLEVFTTSRYEPLTLVASVPLPSPVSSLLHPPTYVNKVLVATRSAGLLLYNVRSRKLLHTFGSLEGRGVINAIVASPDPDTVAVSTTLAVPGSPPAHQVTLLNLRHDKPLFSLSHSAPVHSMSFSATAPSLSTATPSEVHTWDLEKRSLLATYPHGNTAPTSLLYLPNTPTLLATSLNSICMYAEGERSERGERERTGGAAAACYAREGAAARRRSEEAAPLGRGRAGPATSGPAT